MSKIIFWIVIAFVVLFALRMVNVAKSRARRAKDSAKPKAVESMVQCRGCGVFLPRPDAMPAEGGYRCTDPRCMSRNGKV